MKSVRILSHTADIRLLINANSRHELFTAGLLGLEQLMGHKPGVKKYERKQSFTIESPDLTSLFIDFLNEALTYCHIDKCIYDKINRLDFEGNKKLVVELEGYQIDGFKEDIKAVTHHEANITQSGAGIYQTIVVLDI